MISCRKRRVAGTGMAFAIAVPVITKTSYTQEGYRRDGMWTGAEAGAGEL